MRKGQKAPRRCCDELVQQLNPHRANCFENDRTSGSEPGTGHSVTFRYEGNAQRGMCRIDIRCLLQNVQEVRRCDYVFKRCHTDEFHFVELKKTQEWDDAYDQLVATIHHFRLRNAVSGKHSVFAYIISNKTPKVSQPLRGLQDKFLREGKGKMLFRYKSGEEIPLK